VSFLLCACFVFFCTGKLGAVVKRKQRAAESEGEEVEEIEE